MPPTGSQRSRLGSAFRVAVAVACAATATYAATLPAAAIATTSAFVDAWGKNTVGALGAGFTGTTGGAVPTQLSGALAVAAAGSSYAVLESGVVDAWGDDTFGQLGNGTHIGTAVPTPVKGVSGAVAIAAGDFHAMALLSNGTVMTWGANTYGMLGNGTSGHGHEVGEPNPVLVPGLHGVVAIAAGGADDVALLGNGTLEAWGENKSGQLGDDTTIGKDVPTPVKGVSGVQAVAMGGEANVGGHMLVLLQNGTVLGIGGNAGGELGNDSTTNSLTPVTVKGLSGVTALAADVSHSMALLENRTVVTWGSDAFGELGVAAAAEKCGLFPCSRVPVAVGLGNVSAISAGFRFSVAVSAGRPYAWGWNIHKQLGSETATIEPIPRLVPGVAKASAVSAGMYHSLALSSEPPALPALEVSPGAGALTVRWRESIEPTLPWNVHWRLADVHASWNPFVQLPPSARSYTITSLSAVPYEVAVRDLGSAFGIKAAVGTPLAG